MRRFRKRYSSELATAIEALEQAVENKKKEESATPEGLTSLLIKATCDETTAIWQYFVAKFTARGEGRLDAMPEYDEHIKDEYDHLFKIAARLQQLGGKPVIDIAEVNEIGNKWERIETKDVAEQLAILIKAEDSAVAFYKEIVAYADALGDEVTKKLFKEILEDETDHSFDLTLTREELVGGEEEEVIEAPAEDTIDPDEVDVDNIDDEDDEDDADVEEDTEEK